MIIMGIKLDNILCFDNFDIEFSYKKKNTKSLIGNETLKNVPSFRYKKLNIIYGSNASGKTSLIKAIWNTLIFLDCSEKRNILELVNDKNKDAFISIDLVTNDNNSSSLHRFKIICKEKENVLVSHFSRALSTASSTKDSYETLKDVLDSSKDNYDDYLKVLPFIKLDFGWNVIMPATEANFKNVSFLKRDNIDVIEYVKILKAVFVTMDSSIVDVSVSKDTDNAYVITHERCGKIIIQDGIPLVDINKLSSGTKYAINIANMIYSIKHHKNGIYFIDEQFSYVNSDIEASVLTTIVSLLGNDEQVFFTTHNINILSLGFPFHSYYFLKKENMGDKKIITASCASIAENRNNMSPLSIVENDVFSTAPDVSKIFDLEEGDFQ